MIENNPRNHFTSAGLMGALLGAVTFLLTVGYKIIDPRYIGWLLVGDRQQSYLGWVFFRQEPWSFPLGQQHALGLEQASSIVYTDSIPLLAFICKILSPVLPAQFQYAGLWEFTSYILMGWFSWMLVGLYTKLNTSKIIATVLFLISPIMIMRVNTHIALASHWIIIASIYLYYRPQLEKSFLLWGILLSIAALVHAYLMFMAFSIFIAYAAKRGFVSRDLKLTQIAARLAGIGTTLLIIFWAAGYFGDLAISASGFGVYSLNLLGPFVPIDMDGFLLTSIKGATPGQYEGFNYLGLGVLLIAVWVVVRRIFDRNQLFVMSRKDLTITMFRSSIESPLIVLSMALTLLALSNVVTLGNHVLFSIPIPKLLNEPLNIFRASGRMFWPVYYLLMLAFFRLLFRRGHTEVTIVLMIGLWIQLVDLRNYFSMRLDINDNSENHLPQHSSEVWRYAAQRNLAIYVVPGQPAASNSDVDEQLRMMALAAEHRLAIDTAYYGRTTSDHAQLKRTARHEAFLRGKLEKDGIYLVNMSFGEKMKQVEGLFPSDTGVGVIDGYMVVVPHWFRDAPAIQRALLKPPSPLSYSDINLNQIYPVNKSNDIAQYLTFGWTMPGDAGAWSEGQDARLGFHVKNCNGPHELHLALQPYLPKHFDPLELTYQNRSKTLRKLSYNHGNNDEVLVLEPDSLNQCNYVLDILINNPRSPSDAGESIDGRKLGILLQQFTVH